MLKILPALAIILLTSGCADRLYKVNQEVNSYRYMPDKVNFMKSAEEFKRDGGGDCEDFANAKRSRLIELGVPESDIHFVEILRERTTGQAHVVLEVNGLILDNMTDRITPGELTKGYRVNYKQMLTIAGNTALAGR